MSEKLNIDSVKDFLKDYLATSETKILEEGKEHDDILAVAEARGYNLKNRESLAGFKTIYTFADEANGNKARLPKETLLKVLPEIIGTPIDIDHIRDYVVGHYIDYRYVASENKIIAYGVFYKSNFGDEWKKAQELFKKGKLGTSYEIWCPKNKRKYLPDGTYELTTMEIAGGALIFKSTPAFADAKVLEMAKLHMDKFEEELVVASLKVYDQDDLITSSEEVAVAEPVAVVAPVVVTPEVIPQATKIKCSNCNTEFEPKKDLIGNIIDEQSCEHCKAITDKNGLMKYPPQIIDFNVNCPSCRGSSWRLVSNTEESAKMKCLACAKEYTAHFDVVVKSELMNKLAFIFQGSANCLQCGTYIPFSTTSKNNQIDLNCPHCSLNFTVDISKSKNKRRISKIEEAKNLNVASTEGGNKPMEVDKDKVVEPVVVESVPVVEAVVPVEPVVEQIVPVTETVEPVVPVVPAVEVAPVKEPAVVEVAAVVPKAKKTDEEIEKMEEELCKAVKLNKKYRAIVKAACGKAKSYKKAAGLNKASLEEINVVKEENEALKTKIGFLETSALQVIERKNMLGEFGKDLSEKDILDNGKFEMAMVKKENAELKSKLVTASQEVAVKVNKPMSDIAQKAAAINDLAFKTNK